LRLRTDRLKSDNNISLVFIFFLISIGWLYSIVQVVSINSFSSFSDAGPGMEIFAFINFLLFNDPFSFESSLNFCTTTDLLWKVWDFFKAFSMWVAMIFAMMLPCIFAVLKKRPLNNKNTLRFIFGFILVWLIFCIVMVFFQWALRSTEMLDGHMVLSNKFTAALLLALVATYQLSNHKVKNLKRLKGLKSETDLILCCGTKIARSGFSFGKASLKCCFPLMMTMFAFGLMNILATAFLLIVMLAETTSGHKGPVTIASSIVLYILSLLFIVPGINSIT